MHVELIDTQYILNKKLMSVCRCLVNSYLIGSYSILQRSSTYESYSNTLCNARIGSLLRCETIVQSRHESYRIRLHTARRAVAKQPHDQVA